MIFEQIPVGHMENYAYLIGDAETLEGAVIDPGWDVEKIDSIARGHGLQIKYIINTHCHYDHTDGNRRLKDLTNAQVIIHKSEKFYIEENSDSPVDMAISDEDEVTVGKIVLKFIHTPGHSPGSTCILVQNRLITGDTLFIGAIGRTDFPGGSMEKMYESLQKIKALGDDITIYPGHNYGNRQFSTIGEEKKTNPYLKADSLAGFQRIAG